MNRWSAASAPERGTSARGPPAWSLITCRGSSPRCGTPAAHAPMVNSRSRRPPRWSAKGSDRFRLPPHTEPRLFACDGHARLVPAASGLPRSIARRVSRSLAPGQQAQVCMEIQAPSQIALIRKRTGSAMPTGVSSSHAARTKGLPTPQPAFDCMSDRGRS